MSVLALVFVFFLVSGGDRYEQKQIKLKNKCYQLAEVKDVYPSQYECVKDKARRKR